MGLVDDWLRSSVHVLRFVSRPHRAQSWNRRHHRVCAPGMVLAFPMALVVQVTPPLQLW